MTQQKNAPRLDFLSPLSSVPGLGSKRIAALRESGIETIGDLLYHLPRRYLDRSVIIPIARLDNHLEQTCSVIGTITRTRIEKGRTSRFRVQITDNSGSFEALWFHGIAFYRKTLTAGKRVLVYGKVTRYRTLQMTHPLIETIGEHKTRPDIPFLAHYPLTEAMRNAHCQQKILQGAMQWLLKNLQHYPQVLPAPIEQKKKFPPLDLCLKEIHIPSSLETISPCYNRLRYEELYRLALALRWSKRKFALPGRSMSPGTMPDRLTAILPFSLTDDQRQAIAVLFSDAAKPKRMHRLLQGDVGSGKTIVALFACLPALNEGMQVAWLAPTEILVLQTLNTLTPWLAALDIIPRTLKGGMTAKNKQALLTDIRTGACRFVIGTHALFQPSVSFHKLGMIIIDEQHKFGAEQRLALQQKDTAADFLLLSATPIPQTLAKTLYGDLDILSIRSTPAGRQPVSTHLIPEHRRLDMERFIIKELRENNTRAFCIVPRIDTDDDAAPIKDAATVFTALSQGSFAGIPMAMLHGKKDPDDTERVMSDFASGRTRLLVATTVVEVGVDIPDATIIIIENADRFGLSQLHQLRGRVGRGTKKAYAFLLTGSSENSPAMNRLKRFCTMHDGFAIADLDLTIRGPGEVTGTRQSGWDNLRIADILRDADTFREIQEDLDHLLASK